MDLVVYKHNNKFIIVLEPTVFVPLEKNRSSIQKQFAGSKRMEFAPNVKNRLNMKGNVEK